MFTLCYLCVSLQCGHKFHLHEAAARRRLSSCRNLLFLEMCFLTLSIDFLTPKAHLFRTVKCKPFHRSARYLNVNA